MSVPSLNGVLLLGLFTFFGGLAYGQSGVGVQPSRVEVAVEPGSQFTESIRVDNPSETTGLAVTATHSDVWQQPDGEMVWLPPGSHPGSLANWLAVNPVQFTLPPRASETVTYTGTVPADAPPGTYWGVLFLDSEPAVGADGAPAEGVGIRSRVRVGHIIYVHVGTVTREGTIAGVRYAHGSQVDGPDAVRVSFRNTGTGLIRLDGVVEVRDMEGNLMHELPVNGVASFPGTSHEIAIPLPEPLESGEYFALVVLDYGEAAVVAGEGSFTVP